MTKKLPAYARLCRAALDLLDQKPQIMVAGPYTKRVILVARLMLGPVTVEELRQLGMTPSNWEGDLTQAATLLQNLGEWDAWSELAKEAMALEKNDTN